MDGPNASYNRLQIYEHTAGEYHISHLERTCRFRSDQISAAYTSCKAREEEEVSLHRLIITERAAEIIYSLTLKL